MRWFERKSAKKHSLDESETETDLKVFYVIMYLKSQNEKNVQI